MSERHVTLDLLAYLDDELNLADTHRVKAHLEVEKCEACLAELERLRAVRQDFQTTVHRAMDPVRLPRAADERIREQLERHKQGAWWGSITTPFDVGRRMWRWRAAAAYAVLALLIVAFVVPTWQAAHLPTVGPRQETLVLGQTTLTPGTQAALRVLVRDPDTAQPTPNAEVAISLAPKGGKSPGLASPVWRGRTDKLGTAQVAFTVPDQAEGEAELVVETRSDMGTSTVSHAITIKRSFKLYLSSDKPLYQPGQTIHIRALALGAADSKPAAGQQIEFIVTDAAGNKIYRRKFTASNFGIASTDLPLASELIQGDYKLEARLGDTTSTKTVQVKPYVLPKFKVNLETDRQFYRPAEKVTGKLQADYFFGKPTSEAQVTLKGFVRDVGRTQVINLTGQTDAEALTRKAKGDPWLYFYEDFLAAYDPKMRKDRGVYYTPVEVVQAQVRLVAQLLEERFDADFSFVNEKVITLDPGAGTGTYILAALQHGLHRVEQEKGPGMRANFATQAAQNLHAFELLVGPYAVAHLRLTQQILAEGGQMPPDGVHVYLTDTLESPYQPPPQYHMLYKELGEEYKRAQRVKADVPVLVVIGNPPYDRQQIEAEEAGLVRRKGGWVRFGEGGKEGEGYPQDFLKPLEALGWGVHAKNLYNDYVYFWRWALWKVFENKGGPGIVSFITASSYLRGPGFAGMRRVMRETFDELWIIDLEGDNLGARKTENVFAIQTPVAIAVGVRYGEPQPETPAAVHYTRLSGTEEEKLKTLEQVTRFADLPWRACLPGWTDLFLPTSDKPYWNWPLVTDLFPWQVNGVQFKTHLAYWRDHRQC